MTPLGTAHAPGDVLLERLRLFSRGERWLSLSVLGAAALHGLVAIILPSECGECRVLPRADATETFEVEPLPPALPPVTQVEHPEPLGRPPSQPAQARVAARVPTARSVETASAGAALTRTDESEAPADFTDELLTGSAHAYAGGLTDGQGRSARPVHRALGAAPVAPGTDRRTAGGGVAAPSRSRSAGLAGASSWDCPFPTDADREGVHRALATVRVDVDATGRATRALVVTDPGHGFGSAAQRCALARRWVPALNEEGAPIAASVIVGVRFVR
jgi:protein TonB